MKYKTLKDLVEAIKSGEVAVKDCWPMVIDNDSVDLYSKDAAGEDIDECLFEGGPREVLGEAFDLLGIPWQNA